MCCEISLKRAFKARPQHVTPVCVWHNTILARNFYVSTSRSERGRKNVLSLTAGLSEGKRKGDLCARGPSMLRETVP